MELPDDILSAAMLGTAQTAGPHNLASAGSVGSLLAQVEASPAGKLLLAIGGLRLQQQAGWRPVSARPARSTPCEPDAGLPCSPQALRHLVVMLNNYYQQALPEWLAAIQHSGRRIPEEYLPLLLDTGRRLPALQAAIMPLLGNRGLWLAQEAAGNRQWEWATWHKVEAIWQEGKREERLALLKRLRGHEPTRARELLQTSWRTEAAHDREAFLRTFEIGLTPADEPFLESILDERARGTAQVAADLLTRLPTSAYAGRMQQRLGQLLELAKGRKGYRLLLHPASFAGADLERDRLAAYPAKGVKQTAGEWLLAELLTRVAPSTLANQWAITFADLLAAGQAGDLALNFVHIWGLACQRTADTPFALFLLRQALPQLPPEQIAALAPLLPPAEVEAMILAALEPLRPLLDHNHPVFRLMLAHRQPWSNELATLYMARLGRYLQRGHVRPAPETRTVLLHVALYFSPGRRDELLRVLAVETSAPKIWEDMVDDIRLLLAFRQEMHAAIYDSQGET